VLAQYIDSIIMFAIGLYATGVAFGWLAPPTEDMTVGQQWLARYGNWFKILGPVMMLIALILAYRQAAGLGR
jgi:hypothetical protein